MEGKKQILHRRKEVENELLEMLKETGSDFSLDDVRDVIYNEDGQDCLTDIIAMFDNLSEARISSSAYNGLGVTELENVLEIVNDAWNFFPHKSLDGLCPTEKIV